ncbi:MAG: hypothetical protein ACXVDA_02080 [Ktedonobacterales bacterium]
MTPRNSTTDPGQPWVKISGNASGSGERTISAGALRPDITVGDLSLIFEQLQSVHVRDDHRASQLRHRYLTLILDALHAPSGAPLPGPPPSWEEVRSRYDTD